MEAATIEIIKIWFFFSLSIGIWTFLTLTFMKQANRNVNRTLLALVVCLLIPATNGYVQLSTDKPVYWLMSLSQNLTWFYGPLLLFVIKQSLLIQLNRSLIVLHFLPFLLVNIDRQLGANFTGNISVIYVFLIVQNLSYCIYSLILIKCHKERLLTLLREHKDTTFFWLLFLCIGLILLMILDICVIALFKLGYLPNLSIATAMACFLGVYVNIISLLTIHQPELFQQKNISTPTISETPKLRNIELTNDAVEELNEKLNKLVETHKPHLDESISLDKLAALLGVKRNQLSELLNVHQSISFYEFLNELRYQESVALLSSKNGSNSITDIAYQAGFNNRNSFYKVFKEKSGLTPSEYRKHEGLAKSP